MYIYNIIYIILYILLYIYNIIHIVRCLLLTATVHFLKVWEPPRLFHSHRLACHARGRSAKRRCRSLFCQAYRIGKQGQFQVEFLVFVWSLTSQDVPESSLDVGILQYPWFGMAINQAYPLFLDKFISLLYAGEVLEMLLGAINVKTT